MTTRNCIWMRKCQYGMSGHCKKKSSTSLFLFQNEMYLCFRIDGLDEFSQSQKVQPETQVHFGTGGGESPSIPPTGQV